MTPTSSQPTPPCPTEFLVDCYRNLVKSFSLGVAVWDQFYLAQTGVTPLPPLPLRFRIQGSPDIAMFLALGQASRRAIDATVGRLGKWIWDFPEILDFGCGCGRTLLNMRDLTPGVKLSGSDLDADAVAWCQHNLPYATVRVNGDKPPLDFPSDKFDLAYGLSVFTHLDATDQFVWLAELNRVLKPGGLLLLTFLGYHSDRLGQPLTDPGQVLFKALTGISLSPWDITPGQQQELRETGFLFIPFGYPQFFGSKAGNSYHRREYIESEYGKTMDLIEYIPDGLNGALDIALFRKRS